MERPSYQKLHDLFVDMLDYLEKKIGAGAGRKFVEERLKQYNVHDYFGSVLDGKLFEKKPGIPPPSEETMYDITVLALGYVEELHGLGTGGVKDKCDELLKKHGCFEYFGTSKDGIKPQ